MPAHANDDRSVQSRVRLAVSAPVEPVSTVGLPRAGRDRTGAAEFRQGGIGADAIGVVAGGDQHFCCDIGPDAKGGDQLWRCSLGELLELAGVDLDLLM